MENQGEKKCHGGHHKAKACLFVVLGLTFLAQAIGIISWSVVNIIWPILLIIIGIKMMCKCHCKSCEEQK